LVKPWYLCNNSQGRQSHHANLNRSQAGSLTMATPSHARAVKSLNKSPGLHGRRFVVRLSLSLPTTHDLNNFFFLLSFFIFSVLNVIYSFCLDFVFKFLLLQFKTFSQRIEEIEIDVYSSLNKIKSAPSEGSTFLRDCLIEFRVCDPTLCLLVSFYVFFF